MRSNIKIVIRCTDTEKSALLQAKTQLKARTWLELFETLLKKRKIHPPNTIVQNGEHLLEILTELKRCGNNLNQITKVANSNKTISSSEAKQLLKLAISISSLKKKVLKTFVVKGGK